MNWTALILSITAIVGPLLILYVILVIGGLLGKLFWGFLCIVFLIMATGCIYFAIDDEMRND